MLCGSGWKCDLVSLSILSTPVSSLFRCFLPIPASRWSKKFWMTPSPLPKPAFNSAFPSPTSSCFPLGTKLTRCRAGAEPPLAGNFDERQRVSRMGFRGCYQPDVIPSCLGEKQALGSLGNGHGSTSSPWGISKHLLFGERFTCLQKIYLWCTRLGHIYKFLSPRNNTAVCWRWRISSGLWHPLGS